MSAQPLHAGCDTLPVNVLADTRFECETQHDDSVVAWTDGAVRMRGSEGRAAKSSSALVTTGIALSLCLGVGKPTAVRSFWRQSLRCESCLWLLVSCKVRDN